MDPIAQHHIDIGDRLTVRRNHRGAWVLDWDSPDGSSCVGVVGECDPQREFRTMTDARSWAIARYRIGAHYSPT
jgi:hypothetical protein